MAPRLVAKIAASLQMFARSAPVSPLVCWATRSRSTFSSGFSRVCTSSTPRRPFTSGGTTNTWRSKRPGRSSAGSSFSSRFDAAITTTRPLAVEAVHLDQQLVERLVLLARDVHPAPAADRVELVDEDDRRFVLARDREQPADARRAEAREHLHERRRRLGEELRARLVRHRLRQQRLAGARRAVQQDALRHLRAERVEGLRLAQELDDLLQLRLGLVDAGDVRERDRLVGGRLDPLRLDPRHHLQHPPHHENQRREEQDRDHRLPVEREVLDFLRERDVRRGHHGARRVVRTTPACAPVPAFAAYLSAACVSAACVSGGVRVREPSRPARPRRPWWSPAHSSFHPLQQVNHPWHRAALCGFSARLSSAATLSLERAVASRASRNSSVANARSRTSMRSSAPWISGALSQQRLVALREEAVRDALGERQAEVARVGEAREHHRHDLRARVVLADPLEIASISCEPPASGCRRPAR